MKGTNSPWNRFAWKMFCLANASLLKGAFLGHCENWKMFGKCRAKMEAMKKGEENRRRRGKWLDDHSNVLRSQEYTRGEK